MAKEKLTSEKLDALIEDENMAYQEYTRLGLNNLAKDELKHYHFLLKLKRKKQY